MAVTIQSQPAANSINAAYRPIVIVGIMSGVMPIVFCDIYFNGIYYKTLSKTSQASLFPVFDIQDAAQEYLGKFIAPNGAIEISEAPILLSTCLCKLRGSSIDVDGFTIPDPVVPIQATLNTPAVAGTGTETNTFIVVNSSLQHEDIQDLNLHLNTFKTGTWMAETWPLSHRKPNYRVAGSDSFPILHVGASVPDCIKIYYTKKDGTTGNANICDAPFIDCPLLVEPGISWEDYGGGLQRITFSWAGPLSALYNITVQIRAAGSSDPWSSSTTLSSVGSFDIITGHGLFDVRFIVSAVNGSCNPVTTAEFEDQGFPAVCVNPVIAATVLPDAQELVSYNQVIPLSAGTPPYTLSLITKPAWMVMTIVGNSVELTGMPPSGSAAVGVVVAFTISNACADAAFSDTIDIVLSPLGNATKVRAAATDVGTCVALGIVAYLPPPHIDVATGITVYTDAIMTSPLLGHNFITCISNIFAINPLTGVVGADTGLTC